MFFSVSVSPVKVELDRLLCENEKEEQLNARFKFAD